MTLDANAYARANGPQALRAAIDEPPCPPGWSLVEHHRVLAPRMLVKGLLPYAGLAFVGGQSGAGKTFIACDLATAIASGTKFFNRPVKERVGVAFIAAEGGEQLGNRLLGAAHARGLKIGDLPIAWRGDAPALKTPRDVEAVADQLGALGAFIRARYRVRLGVAILDTVAATFDLEDEDKNSEVARAIRKMRSLGERLGALIIPVHHYGKTAATGLRGGSGWRAGADVVLSVIAERKELTGEITGRELALAKARDGIEGPIAPFALTFTQLGSDEDGEAFGTCIVEPRFGEAFVSSARKVREPASLRAFRAAFTEAMDTCGQTIRVRGDGPAVRAAKVTDVRAQFDRRYATGESDPKKRADAGRKAFGRALDRLAQQFPTCVQEDTEWVWSANKRSDGPDTADISDIG